MPEELQSSWDEAAKQMDDGDPEKAMDALRSAWNSIENDSQRARTLRLAADAGTEMGLLDEQNQKSHWQKAYKNYSKALSLNSSNKETRRSMNKLASMMDERAISLGLGFKIFDEGNPTPLGVLVILVAMVVALSSFKLISDLFDDQGNPVVVFEVQYTVDNQQIVGEIEIELYEDDAPMHVESFLSHVENYQYDMSEFHRVIEGFMIQGGDIEGRGGAGGYSAHYYGLCNGVEKPESQCALEDWSIPHEHENGLMHTAGAVAAAHAGVNTDGSQFYIVPEGGSAKHLDWSEGKDCTGQETPNDEKDDGSCHTVFGYVISGLEHVNSISEVPTSGQSGGNTPLENVILLSAQTR
ncbi:MAG: peptidylprolyl isomerase [Candidatus Thalassarchaeum sp.]|nr:peptidylprolyl isomerase [Candidatus Thalassarchaeum sp.]